MNSMYSDYERKLIAEKEYDKRLQVDNDICIETQKSFIGTVRRVIENETGIKVYVVESPDQSLLYTISKSVHDIFVKYHKGDAMKSFKIIGIVLVSLLVIVGLSIGGYKVMKQAEHDEMVRIVESEEVKEIIEHYLNYIDGKAFTNEGVIQSYEIDTESIQHNPMGGINFSVYVNEDNELYVRYTLEKNSQKNKVDFSSGGYSGKLHNLIKEK